ncbi:hypothetical protein [Crassaminicella profunda]|uniref:hypothetical protein n=1 Tax=Crassaminicella profunda TaxID=1286698 RepID=UPI001CA78D6C|nr:hypothetical protein [Crassaminicella profunda]QZY56459.1 hypothetical protein K7H06_05910 [Crassaminicella profunda]
MRCKRYRRRKMKGSLKAFISILLIFLILIYGFLLVDQKIKPAFKWVAEVNLCVSEWILLRLGCAMGLINFFMRDGWTRIVYYYSAR